MSPPVARLPHVSVGPFSNAQTDAKTGANCMRKKGPSNRYIEVPIDEVNEDLLLRLLEAMPRSIGRGITSNNPSHSNVPP
jgi:hypothetical protein